MEAKGESIISTELFVRDRFGEDGFNRWLSSLSPVSRDIYSASILASVWYPMKEAYIDPNIRICDVFYSGDIRKGSWDCGRFAADHGLKGIYKAFVRMASPNFLIKRAATVFSTYFRPCRMEVAENGRSSGCLRITEFGEIAKTVEYRIAGWMERAIEICGSSAVNVEIRKALSEGDAVTEFVINWK